MSDTSVKGSWYFFWACPDMSWFVRLYRTAHVPILPYRTLHTDGICCTAWARVYGPLRADDFVQCKSLSFSSLVFPFLIFFFSHLRVPVPLSRCLYHLQYLVFLYCLVAIGFNIAEIFQSSPFNLTALTGVGPLSNQTIRTLNSSAWNNSRLQSMHNRRWRINNHLLTNGTL